MNIDGNKLISIICDRLDIENVRVTDSMIIRKISFLTFGELNQIVSFGNTTKWRNEKINLELEKKEKKKHA